jgi:2-methylaconitate cis-trans-isomerase PrpF
LDHIEIDRKIYRTTIIDAGNLTAQVYATEIGLEGTEIDETQFKAVMPLIKKIHVTVREKLALNSPALPKIMIIKEASNYLNRSKQIIKKEQITLCARDITWGKLFHKSFPITGAVAFAVSCRIPGTLTNIYANIKDERLLKIGHPSGILEVDAVVNETEAGWEAQKIIVGGSASALLDGKAWVPEMFF